MALLRLAQRFDLNGQRESAAEKFRLLAERSECPELREIADAHKNKAFSIAVTAPTMLLREFALDLHRFKRQHP